MGKYLAFKTLYTNESWPYWSLHPCFANKAQLNSLSFLKPIPPQLFRAHNFSQLIQTIFLSSFLCPRQKLRIILVKSSHKESGNLKTLIIYVGIAYAITFINPSFPTLDNNFSFHLASFFLNMSSIELNVFFLFLPANDGKPRYFSWCLIT